MSSEEFSHSDSYKGYVNSIIQGITDRNVSDPVWGNKIPSNYEELRQNCLQFVDKYSTSPSIITKPIISTLEPFVSNLPNFNSELISNFRENMIYQIKIQRFREICQHFLNGGDISKEVAQEHFESQLDLFQHETEPFTILTEQELSGMCLNQYYSKSEHKLFISCLGEIVSYFPYSKISETTNNLIGILVSNHPNCQIGSEGSLHHFPPLILNSSESLDLEIQRLSENFSITISKDQPDILYNINKYFSHSVENSFPWNILCVNDQINDPAASSVQFKLYAAKAHVSLIFNDFINFIPFHKQLNYIDTFLDSYGGKVDEILLGEESFLHIASSQVVHQHINDSSKGNIQSSEGQNNLNSQKHNGIIKLKFLRTQNLRQTVLSTVNWMISLLKNIELDIRDISNPNCLSDSSIIFERDTIVESKQFPHCIVVRNITSSHNVIYEETLELMERIRKDILNFGSFYIRKWEKECGSQIDRKSIVEDLYESECKYQNAKKSILDSLYNLYQKTFDIDQNKKIFNLMKYIVFVRPLLPLDNYNYFMIPYDLNTNILNLQAKIISSNLIKSIEDIEILFNSIQHSSSIISLKQNTLSIDALLNLEFLICNYLNDKILSIGEKDIELPQLINNIPLSRRMKNVLTPGSPQSIEQVSYFSNLQIVRFEVERSIIIYDAYQQLCKPSNENSSHHLPKSLFSDLISDENLLDQGLILSVDEVKDGHVELAGDGLDIINRLQIVENSLLDAVVSFNFFITEMKLRIQTLKNVELPNNIPLSYQSYFNLSELEKSIEFLSSRKYPPFQTIIQLKTTNRESLQTESLNAGSHFDELLNAYQKQNISRIQFLQNRGKLPDVLKLLSLFSGGNDKIPTPLEGFSIYETGQESTQRDRARSILEFYSIVLLYAFLSYHSDSLNLNILKLHKHKRKNRYSAPHLTSLIEETTLLQHEAQKTQTAKTFASDLLLRLQISCIESGLEFGRSSSMRAEDNIPPILDLNSNWTIGNETITRKSTNLMKIIENQLDRLMNLNISYSNLHFLFLWEFDDEQRQLIKKKFDSLPTETQLVAKFRILKQKTLLIRLISSPTFSAGEICEFPSPFNHILLILDSILGENSDSLRFILLHILIQRCIRKPKALKPQALTIPPLVTEKSPFLADVDSLPQDTKSETLHPALAQFIEELQLHSTSESRNEIKISQYHVNQALLKFSQTISQLFDSSLVQSHKAFLSLHTMLFEANQKHEEQCRKRVMAINREARTFNRKLQTDLADRSHTIGYEINLLQETLKSSKFDKKERQEAIRRKLKEEYSPQVREMTLHLFTLKHNLEQYQKNLQHEIEGNMFEIKKQSISQLLRSQNLPEEVKDSMKQAFDFDDALHDLMEQKSELSSTVFKLKAMRLLQDFSVRSDFQAKLKKIEEQREMVKQENLEFSKERDVKEAALKQQYNTVMQSVRAAEKEVEKLRRELELENKNRNKLRDWRTKHEKKVTSLENKLKNLTEWSKYKPDKLIFELEKTEKEIERLKRAKERAPLLLEKTKATVEKELKRCQNQLKAQEAVKDDLEKAANASLIKQNLTFTNEMQNEDLIAVMEENQRLKEENESLQQRLAELSLQIAAVSQINIGGLKVKASRRDGLC